MGEVPLVGNGEGEKERLEVGGIGVDGPGNYYTRLDRITTARMARE